MTALKFFLLFFVVFAIWTFGGVIGQEVERDAHATETQRFTALTDSLRRENRTLKIRLEHSHVLLERIALNQFFADLTKIRHEYDTIRIATPRETVR